MLGRAYGIPAVALRFFNTYGPYQALSNPYTGVLSNFAVARAERQCAADLRGRLAEARFRQRLRRGARLPAGARHTAGRRGAFNISSGEPMTVKEVAERTVRAIGRPDIEPRDHR